MNCKNCGKQINEADRFCPNCGTKLSDATVRPQTYWAPSEKPFLGLSYAVVTKELQQQYSLPISHGFLVIRDGRKFMQPAVIFNTPAYRAGIQEFDVVVEIESKPIVEGDDLLEMIGHYKIGDTIVFTIYRKGEILKLPIELDRIPDFLKGNSSNNKSTFWETEKEIQDCDEKLRREPKNTDAMNFKGFLLSFLHKYKEAIQVLDKSFKIDENIDALHYKLEILIETEEYQEAVELCNKIISETDSKDIDVLNSKAGALIELEDYAEALKTTDEVLKIDPENETALEYKEIAIDEGELGLQDYD